MDDFMYKPVGWAHSHDTRNHGALVRCFVGIKNYPTSLVEGDAEIRIVAKSMEHAAEAAYRAGLRVRRGFAYPPEAGCAGFTAEEIATTPEAYYGDVWEALTLCQRDHVKELQEV